MGGRRVVGTSDSVFSSVDLCRTLTFWVAYRMEYVTRIVRLIGGKRVPWKGAPAEA